MKIRTEILQKLVSKAIQGSSNNRMIPLTSLIGIEYLDSKLTLITTDGSNQFRVIEKIEVPTEDDYEFYTIVNADTFSKLVGKTTKEFIELENKENYLEVKGNGTYKLEIAINEEGEMVRFPNIVEELSKETIKLNLNDLQEAIKVAKASVAKTLEVPCLTGYYLSKNIISTDRQLVCKINKEIVTEPILISSEMAELLLLVGGDEILELVKKDNNLIFYNANYTIAGKELEGKELYPVQPIENLTNLAYNNSIKVNKQELLAVLDRMNLFVTDYDKGGIYLNFTAKGLEVKSQKSSATEIIDIEQPETFINQFNCLIDIEMLRNEIMSVTTEEIEIQYGQEKSIKIVDNNAIFIISLLDKSN